MLFRSSIILHERFLAENKQSGFARVPQDLADLQRDVHAALDTLDPVIQYAAWRVHVDGYTDAFVAEEVGWPRTTLRRKLHLDLTRLRKPLRAYAPQGYVEDTSWRKPAVPTPPKVVTMPRPHDALEADE